MSQTNRARTRWNDNNRELDVGKTRKRQRKKKKNGMARDTDLSAKNNNKLGKRGKGSEKMFGGKKKLEWQETVTGWSKTQRRRRPMTDGFD